MDTYICKQVMLSFTGQREMTDELRAAAATLAEQLNGCILGCRWLLGVVDKIPSLIAADARLQAYLQRGREHLDESVRGFTPETLLKQLENCRTMNTEGMSDRDIILKKHAMRRNVSRALEAGIVDEDWVLQQYEPYPFLCSFPDIIGRYRAWRRGDTYSM